MGVNAMGLREIEEAIAQLAVSDLDQLVGWLAEYRAQVWDKSIEADLEAGHLDVLLGEIDKEYEAGLSQPL